MYCSRGSLAVEETVLQYSLVGSRFVLQYKQYFEPRVGLCRDTARARQLGAGARSRRWGAQQALGRAAGAGARSRRWGAQQARALRGGARGVQAASLGARAAGRAQRCARQRARGNGRAAAGARCLGVRAGQGYALGLFSTRFDSVLFLSRFLDIVFEPGS